MKRTMFITMLAATLLGAQGRAADHIPTTITGWTHADESNWNFYGKYSETDAVTGGDVGIREDAQSGINHWYDNVYGGYSRFGTASGNNVTMDSGEVYSIFGGESLAGACVSGNTVTMNGGVVYDNLCGGFTDYDSENPKFEDCINNTVTVNGGVVSHGFVKGGWAAMFGCCSGNTVTMNGGDVTYGNVVGGDSNFGNSTGNSVSTLGVISSTGVLEVVGGTSWGGEASGNKVDALESTLGAVTGGRSVDWHANDNKVTITDSLISGSVEGARAADASGNKVTITDSQMQLAEGSHILGGYATSRDATGNSVTITGTEFLGDYLPEVLGGHADAGNANGNSVDMTGGHVSSVYGGRGLASANENKVTLTDVQVDEYVFGGDSEEGDANGNSVTLQNTKAACVYAGYSQNGHADGNKVTANGGQIGQLLGARSGGESGGASGNTVDVTGIQGEWVYGAHALNGDANSNTVTVTDSIIGTTIYGGSSYQGNTTGNRVTMTGGQVFSVEGGMSNRGQSTGNTVTLTNVAASIVDGGQSYASTDGKANDNTVTVTDSQIESSVYGGNSYGEGEASGNSVTMNGGTAYNVIGGYVGKGAAIGNTVIVTGGQVTKNIAGGWLYKGGELRDNRVYLVGSGAHAVIGGQVYDGRDGGIQALAIAAGITDNAAATAPLSGNSIDVYGTNIVTGRMYGMQILNFHIMEGLANFEEAAMVSITGTVGSDRLDLTSVQLGFYGESVEDWSAFAGKSVTLVEAAQEILGVDSGTQVDILIGDQVVGAAALVLGSGNKTLSLENIVFVPEPATGTLGLLALAALAARRRKNQSTK